MSTSVANKLEIHYTPKYGSWLNMSEIEMSIMSRQCLGERMDNIQQLAKEVLFWQRHHNCKQMKVDWRFTADDARIK
ncbi:MAG: transposase [Sedimentisphaerales bacterium]|nr:transposase [Sedimentisphaerales bacterium]